MKKNINSRRNFIKKSIVLPSIMILPRHVLGGKGYTSPSDKLNIAGIGVRKWGMGAGNLSQCETENISLVWLREYRNFNVLENGHPVIPTIHYNLFRLLGNFKERNNTWYGFTFNPGLRRKKDYLLLAPLSQYIGSNECNSGGVEQALSNLYFKKGLSFAITLKEKGYVRHIGWDNPTNRNTL